MGCENSKIKKKPKDRDTLSREGARQTAKERQAAAEQARDNTDLTSPPVNKNSEALEVPVPNQAGRGSVVASPPEKPLEEAVQTTTLPEDAPPPLKRNEAKKIPGYRASSDSIESVDSESDKRTATSSSQAQGRQHKKNKKDHSGAKAKKKDRKKHRRSKVSSSSEDEVKSGSRKGRFDEYSLSASSKECDAKRQGSTTLEKDPLASARGRSHSRPASTFGSGRSIEFESDAVSRVVSAAPLPNADGSAVIASGPPRASFHAMPEDSTVITPENVNDTEAARNRPSLVDDGHAPLFPSPAFGAAFSAADTGRVAYEPYNDFGPREVDDQLPPYEWVLRTMPVPSPLRQSDDVEADREVGGIAYFNSAPSAGVAPPSRCDDADAAPSVHFYNPALDDYENGLPPLVPRTFYPRLPPVQWASHSVPPPSQPSYEEEEAAPDSVEEDTGDDTPALYSPADTRHNQFGRESWRPASPSLVDAYVSDDDVEGQRRHHRSSRAGYDDDNSAPPPSSYYPPPRISILPSPYAYGPSPMVSAASVVSADENRDGNSYAGRPRSTHVAQGGVNAHQYKPVTYLFDNSMDNWLQTRQAAAPQRELYANAADLW
ncbi:hypothetical protein ABB37_01281 [Leptomonas pyrrhocoris]|uniref:Uncharacterized protein n=1 Tax=Leptomonas pyrrhocoris TaxID=157538 RepID=A0A0M9G8Q8_LEPPY|nr:hypothetical protein ABB37_01281 [Leptomonas pyrrhocoris]KPA84799.1 hypothetical protein ABB37_01281 [Leptomonas pyrrhocoris]|eukprot:XP_015663238.1 hypothetical protein ABB37_01281 [Leptomonas pyrrhocoris]